MVEYSIAEMKLVENIHSLHFEITGTLDVHEEGVGALHETLQFVGTLFRLRARIQQVDSELHSRRMKWGNEWMDKWMDG